MEMRLARRAVGEGPDRGNEGLEVQGMQAEGSKGCGK